MPSGKRRVHSVSGRHESIPSAVAMMTTADGMHPAFSGRHPLLFFLFPYFNEKTRTLTKCMPTSHEGVFVKIYYTLVNLRATLMLC